MKLTAYQIGAQAIDIRPARLERDWMDATHQRFAYRCLPLNIANTHGWEILCPSSFKAVWDGEPNVDSIRIESSEGIQPPAISHFGAGVLTFQLPCLFKTETGFDLMVQGPVNRPKDAIAPLSAIVEADWAPYTFTMNWLFTQPEIEVEFERGEPICHIFPLRRGEIETVDPELRSLASDPALQQQYRTWTASRRAFNADLKTPGSEAGAEKWQKQYYRGIDAHGRPGTEDHRTRVKLKTFERKAKAAPSPRHAEPSPKSEVAANTERDLVSQEFDREYYLAANPDVATAGMEPVDHFLKYGWREGRNPNSKFDTAYYLQANPDVAATGANPFHHYLLSGRAEGRAPARAPSQHGWPPLRVPDGVRVPRQFRAVFHGSPILRRVPPAEYLERILGKTSLHNRFGTMQGYLRRAVLQPHLIRGDLAENDIRVISMMDDHKRRLTRQFENRPAIDLVSIILPTRNRADLIVDAIASVLVQSYANWQLVIVDDAGEDHTEAVVSQFRDPRIEYLRLAVPSGFAGSRNAGLRHASGSLIAHLDDDNLWDPDFLLVSVHTLRERGARMLYSAQMVWRGFDPHLRLGQSFTAVRFAPFNRSLLENTNYIDTNACVHDRGLIDEAGPFDTGLDRFVDWDFFLRLTEIETPTALPCLLSHYFRGRTPQSMSDNDPIRNIRRIQAGLLRRSGGGTTYDNNGAPLTIFGTADRTRQLRSTRLEGLSIEKVAIVIPNHECIQELEACLESLAAHTSAPQEIIIADNQSSPETRQKLETLVGKYPDARWIEVDEHAGFTFAVNAGIEEAAGRGRDVVIINNDAIVTPNWLEELRYVLRKHPDVGMAVPRQVVPSGHQHARTHVPSATDTFELDVNLSAHHDNVVDPSFDAAEGFVEVSYAPLFCALIRAETLAAAGPLDSGNGPHFRSDWIFCEAVRTACRQKIVYTPHSKVYHLQGVATRARKASAAQMPAPR